MTRNVLQFVTEVPAGVPCPMERGVLPLVNEAPLRFGPFSGAPVLIPRRSARRRRFVMVGTQQDFALKTRLVLCALSRVLEDLSRRENPQVVAEPQGTPQWPSEALPPIDPR